MRERFLVVAAGAKTYYNERQAEQAAEKQLLDSETTVNELWICEVRVVSKRVVHTARVEPEVIGG